jgi:hypothetical protein
MAIEPTSVQRDKMLSRGKTKQVLVQFLALKTPGMEKDYLRQSQHAVQDQGGSRDHLLKIQQALTPGKFPYQYITVDRFPSSQALLQTHELTRDIRTSSLNEIYGLIVKPDPSKPLIAKGLAKLESVFTRLLNSANVQEFSESTHELDPLTDPAEDKVKEFRSGDQEQPCLIINLNKFNPGGKSIYNQYSLRVTPYLASVGGFPEIYGDVFSTFIGDQSSSLDDRWHGFALVYYPSRNHFLRMMTNTPTAAAQLRRAGLERAVLMVCSNTPVI